MQQLFKHSLTLFFTLALLQVSLESANAQYSRGNSPYSRYGLGDLRGSNFAPNAAMSGGQSATYRSYWDVNLTNPASFGKLRYASFQIGLDYQHSELSERSTGLTAKADNGNLSYISLAFPITKSWEIMRDTLRREIPIQWGMGFSLVPYSTVGYDVAIVRSFNGINDVRYNYTGEGNKYRVNWSNGATYKGFSVGANLGLLFGKLINKESISFQDAAYNYDYDNDLSREESGVGFAWDIGAQYEYLLKSERRSVVGDGNFSFDKKIVIGAYAGGVTDIKTDVSVQYVRRAAFRPVDSIQNISGVAGQLKMPLKIGAGIGYGRELGTLIGFSYESEFWSNFERDGQKSTNLGDAHRVAVGLQIVPDFADYNNYLNRVRYRFGAHYGLDARTVAGADGNRYQLVDYGVSVGAGFPMRPPKSKSILGFLNLGVDVGYLGHPELIGDFYVKVNLGFALNASGWFNRAKFR
ncbi:MAG: hypothetical protein ACRBFS_09000 [Aureispira sp.]